MASKEENAWARSARKAYGMKQGATWDNMARNDAIKKVWANKPRTLSSLQATKLISAKKKSSGSSGG